MPPSAALVVATGSTAASSVTNPNNTAGNCAPPAIGSYLH